MSDVANTAAQVAGPDLSVILIDISVLTMMAITAIAIARLRSLFALVMLSGVYSLLSATWFVLPMPSTLPLPRLRLARAFHQRSFLVPCC